MNRFMKNRGVDLNGARVVITGASSGIGRSLATAIAQRGGRLVLAARRADPLLDAAHAIATRCDCEAPLAVPSDVQDPASVEYLIETAIGHLGGIDVLVNNAGTCVYGEAIRTSGEDIEDMLRVHVLGPYYGMQAVIPEMKRQGHGLIVNVASIAAFHGVPYLSSYGAAKAAEVSLSQSIRTELQGTGVDVMVVCPNYTDTNLFAAEKNVGGARRPKGRYKSADAVAESIVKAIERGRKDLVLTFEGKMLYLMRSLWPNLVDLVFNRMAARLQEDYRHA